MAVLVCGGAGYIGSHTVVELLEKGEDVIVLDNFSKGYKEAVWEGAKIYNGDLRDNEILDEIFSNNDVEAVIDFAADSLVGESMEDPLKYFENNVYGTISLLKKMKEYNIDKIIFSSTAATYGEPEKVPIVEDDPQIPTNPYGDSKLSVEKILKWSDLAYDIKYVVLRYFNVAGAHISGKIGEAHSPETHLIPIILQVALEQREKIYIFGEDYDTRDGSCIRDYIHVTDLSNAHILALEKLKETGKSEVYNLGNGEGFSVKEVINTAREVTGHPIPAQKAPRRAGDPAKLVASSKKAMSELGWKPEFADLKDIIGTAWKWHKNNPNGYEK